MANMFAEDHPIIITYNGNLISSYSKSKENKEANTQKVKQIMDKNLEIAKKTFKETSLHLLYHLQSNFINRVALNEIVEVA